MDCCHNCAKTIARNLSIASGILALVMGAVVMHGPNLPTWAEPAFWGAVGALLLLTSVAWSMVENKETEEEKHETANQEGSS